MARRPRAPRDPRQSPTVLMLLSFKKAWAAQKSALKASNSSGKAWRQKKDNPFRGIQQEDLSGGKGEVCRTEKQMQYHCRRTTQRGAVTVLTKEDIEFVVRMSGTNFHDGGPLGFSALSEKHGLDLLTV